MNWAKGLFRVWLVLSLGWVAFTFWQATTFTYTDLVLEYGGPQWSRLGIRMDMAKQVLSEPEQYLWLFGPPIGVLVIGYLVLWAVSGFKKLA